MTWCISAVLQTLFNYFINSLINLPFSSKKKKKIKGNRAIVDLSYWEEDVLVLALKFPVPQRANSVYILSIYTLRYAKS